MDAPRQKPGLIPVNADSIPASMKAVERWLAWSWTWNGKKFDKPPLNARSGKLAKSTDPSTWCSFQEAIDAHLEGKFDGVGFALGNDPSGTCFSGLDIDKCRDPETEAIGSDAVFLASVVDSYTEVSPSGLGLKVFCTGALVGQGRKKDDARGIEFYDGARYFTVTGLHLSWSPREINHRSQQLTTLRSMVFPPPLLDRLSNMSERDLACSALAGLSKTRAAGYDSWLRVGMALKSVSPDLLGAWDDWSMACPEKYTAGACDKKWSGFKTGGVGIGSLIHWAKEDGWSMPEGGVQRQVSRLPMGPVVPADLHNTNGHADIDDEDPEDNDPSMGNRLTETDNAGPWRLMIETSNPRRYWLKSPIWQHSAALQRTGGYILLTKTQLMTWLQIRRESLDQAGVYAGPDAKDDPVWDGRFGPRLLRRLLHCARFTESSPDFDKVLAAAEYIVDWGKKSPIITKEKYEQFVGLRSVLRLEDGAIIFKLRAVSSHANKEAAGIIWEDIREAASRYGEPYWPDINGTRHRYQRFTSDQVKKIEAELSRRCMK